MVPKCTFFCASQRKTRRTEKPYIGLRSIPLDVRKHRLMIAFLDITLHAEHLAVLGHGLAALRPRNDVIALHLLKFERLAAERALVPLSFIRRQTIAFIKHTDI